MVFASNVIHESPHNDLNDGVFILHMLDKMHIIFYFQLIIKNYKLILLRILKRLKTRKMNVLWYNLLLDDLRYVMSIGVLLRT